MLLLGDQYLGAGHAKKRARLRANSSRIAARLARAQCNGGNRGVHPVHFRSCLCQKYQEVFCREVCLGFHEGEDGRGKEVHDPIMSKLLAIRVGDAGYVESRPRNGLAEHHHLHHGGECCGDIHDKPLGTDRIIKARKFEIDFFKGMGVYTQVPKTKQFH